MCETNVTQELENADKVRQNFLKCYLDGDQDCEKHPTFVLPCIEIWFQFCRYMTSHNNSFSKLIHEVSLRDAVSANGTDSPVNFWENTFSPISLGK